MKRSDLLAHIPPKEGKANGELEIYSSSQERRSIPAEAELPALTVLVGKREAELTACLLRAALGPRAKVGQIGPEDLDADDVRGDPCGQRLRQQLLDMARRGCAHVLIRMDRDMLARREWIGLPVSVAAPVGPVWDWDGLDSLLAQTDITVSDLDEQGTRKPQKGGVFAYSENKTRADLLARNLRAFPGHTEFEAVTLGQIRRIHLPVPGGFAVYHGLAALSCGLCLGLSLSAMAQRLRTVRGPAGCMEVLSMPAAYTVLLDRAESVRQLEQVLVSARSFTAGRLVCVLEQDMGSARRELAAQLADRVVLTGRAERRQNICRVLDRAGVGDVIVLAGTDGGQEERRFIRNCAHERTVRGFLRQERAGGESIG